MDDIFNVMSMIGSVLIIVGVIVLTYFASRWYARRMGMSGMTGKYVKVLDRTNLGQSTSLLIVEVAEKYYLIGVSEKSVSMLCELPDDFQRHVDDAAGTADAQAPFSQMLRGLMNRPAKDEKDGGGAQ